MNKTTSKTVLKDEKLGVMREYDEVKRKAEVGEKVKVVSGEDAWYEGKVGEVFDVINITILGHTSSGDTTYVDRETNSTTRCAFIEPCDYVTLEPTDVIHVNGERYRMVERKAEVGEKVIVVADALRNISLGTIGMCTVNDEFDDGSIDIRTETGRSRFLDVDGGEQDYRVLIPLPSANTTETDDESSDTLDLIANLTAKVTTMDKRIKALEERLLTPDTVKAPIITSKPLTRDDVIEMAKKDVEALKGGKRYYSVFEGTNPIPWLCNAEFIVNREKRTVVALLKGYESSTVYTKGIAKAAPDDVFNASIGRAIALRRALGLEVPSEYTNAPQPTEARVGDIVRYDFDGSAGLCDVRIIGANDTVRVHKTACIGSAVSNRGQIIDDSRE